MSDPCTLFDGLIINSTDPLEDRLRFTALKNCIPLHISLELTQACNFRCSHCYNFDRTTQLKPPHRDKSLSLQDWKDVVIQAREKGAFFFCFTGGEVLLVPFLDQLIAFTKDQGASVRLKTNGSLLSDDRAKTMKELGVDDIEFSLYGAQKATHDAFTGTTGHFEKVINGLRSAKRNQLNPVCNIILHRHNAHELSEMKKILHDLNITSQVSLDLSVRHDGTDGSLDYRLTHHQLNTVFKSPEGKSLLPKRNTTGNIQCACARSNCGIGFDGSVYPCIGAPILAGNILKQSFQEIWDHSPVFKEIRGLKLSDYKDCNTCNDREYCQRSSGLIYLNTGVYTGAEKHTCDTAALIKSLNN